MRPRREVIPVRGEDAVHERLAGIIEGAVPRIDDGDGRVLVSEVAEDLVDRLDAARVLADRRASLFRPDQVEKDRQSDSDGVAPAPEQPVIDVRQDVQFFNGNARLLLAAEPVQAEDDRFETARGEIVRCPAKRRSKRR
ncbi:MAG: hypothetical protein II557_06805 [Clostridia bacterium]|nr:hypothetical protein [Clostridia bacterium]